tara:strand:+ start:371 stop:568 length:198 start_codon:yes stop_codon:yes gene_type:complete
VVLEKQIQAYVEKHHLEELPNPRNGVLHEHRLWKSKLDKDLWYSESEINDLIINEEINKAEMRFG